MESTYNEKNQAEIFDKRGSDDPSEEVPGQDGDEPTQHERATLLRIGDSLPMATWLVAIVELCERFTYYGCQGIFQNYILKAYGGRLGNGGLGLGAQAATGLGVFFQFFCYGVSAWNVDCEIVTNINC